MARKWRSVTFQCINVAIMGSNERYQVEFSPLAKLNADNIEQATNRILVILSEIAGLSNNSVGGEVEDKVRQVADLAVEIALQFGINSTQLQLIMPNRGEQVEIGEEFYDCEDGDCNKGASYTVDLVVLPGLQKLGDGKSDANSKRTIVPCEFYPE